jgi:hypothetical protein
MPHQKLETNQNFNDALGAELKHLATGPIDNRSIRKMLDVMQKKIDSVKRMSPAELAHFFRDSKSLSD